MNGRPEETLIPDLAKRNATVELLIKDALRSCLRPIPDEETLVQISAAWNSVLTEIPTQQLYDTYLEAARRHVGHKPLTAFEIAHTWRKQEQAENIALLLTGNRDTWQEDTNPN
jgi:hypothetical protein